jgi:hypothetical protein
VSKHMHFHREIDQLKKTILDGHPGGRPPAAGLRPSRNRDEDEARKIMTADWEIDDMEIRVEEECLKILALHQPVARDLRLIVSIIKINTELERIADIAVNIAKRILSPSTVNKTPDYFSATRLPAHGNQGHGDGQNQPGCPGDRRCGSGPGHLSHGRRGQPPARRSLYNRHRRSAAMATTPPAWSIST